MPETRLHLGRQTLQQQGTPAGQTEAHLLRQEIIPARINGDLQEHKTGEHHQKTEVQKQERTKPGRETGCRMIQESREKEGAAVRNKAVQRKAGMAQAICAKLDSTELLGAVGTLAGDDTIFILMRTERDAERLVKELKNIINTKI